MTAVLARCRPASVGLLLALVAMLVTACGLPHDSAGTLDRIRSEGVLRAGASPHPPHVELPDATGAPSGIEIDLVRGYAENLGATVEWVIDSEAALIEALERGELDVVVAGIYESSPWSDLVALTRPYAETIDTGGNSVALVMAVRAGENGLLVDLERWLQQHAGELS